MRRGYTIIELLVSLALLAAVVTVSLRLLFTSDRALGAEGERAAAVGMQGELLSDLGRDLRGASAAAASGAVLRVGEISYRSADAGVVRSAAGQPQLDRSYPHLQARFARSGALVLVDVTSSAGRARTGFALRN